MAEYIFDAKARVDTLGRLAEIMCDLEARSLKLKQKVENAHESELFELAVESLTVLSMAKFINDLAIMIGTR